jgi:nucleoside-triphosphatase
LDGGVIHFHIVPRQKGDHQDVVWTTHPEWMAKFDRLLENLRKMDMSQNPTLFLITGSRGAGKTTFCDQLARDAREAGWQVAGLISRPIFSGPRRTAIDAEDQRTGDTRRLAVAAPEGEPPTPGTKSWQFDPAALAWGNQVLATATPCDLLVVDELGPLELERGTGWQAGLSAVDSRQYAIALVVIRAELLGEALLRWDEANLVEIDTPEDCAYKAAVLSKQLF